MSFKSDKEITTVHTTNVSQGGQSHDIDSLRHADDVLLAELGYKSEFKREFSVSIRQLRHILLH